MEKLNLPIIKNIPEETKWLSMDEYLEFVIFNLENPDSKINGRKWKRLLAVNVPFSLK